jgi:hypothetical protein
MPQGLALDPAGGPQQPAVDKPTDEFRNESERTVLNPRVAGTN